MADLFSVTAPLAIRYPDGEKQIMIERFAWQEGLLYLPVFWTETGLATAIRFVHGPVKGDGPWKVGDAVVTVLGCHGTDADLANRYADWQHHLAMIGDQYPEQSELKKAIEEYARKDNPA